MSEITLHTAILDGKRIAFSSETEFKVQVAKGKGTYKTRISFKGDIGMAVAHFNVLTVSPEHKKRLLMVGAKRPVLTYTNVCFTPV